MTNFTQQELEILLDLVSAAVEDGTERKAWVTVSCTATIAAKLQEAVINK